MAADRGGAADASCASTAGRPRNDDLLQFQADILGDPGGAAARHRDDRVGRRLAGRPGGRVLGVARRAGGDPGRRPAVRARDGRRTGASRCSGGLAPGGRALEGLGGRLSTGRGRIRHRARPIVRSGAAKIGYRHARGLPVDCAWRGTPRLHRLVRTFDTWSPPAQTLEDPGKRRRLTEEIGTWPTRP